MYTGSSSHQRAAFFMPHSQLSSNAAFHFIDHTKCHFNFFETRCNFFDYSASISAEADAERPFAVMSSVFRRAHRLVYGANY